MSLADESDKFKFDKIYMVCSVVAAVAIYFLLQTTVGVGKVAAIACRSTVTSSCSDHADIKKTIYDA